MKKEYLAKVFIAAGQAVDSVSKAKNKKSVFKNVAAFQKMDGTLKVDGQWGINTSTAAAWYLQHDVPPSAFSGGKLTWQPPDLSENATDPVIAKKVAAVKIKKSQTSPFAVTKASSPAVQSVLATDAPAFGQSSIVSGSNNDVEATIAKYLTSTVNPKIDEIQTILKNQQLSKLATGEHKSIVKRDNYQKQVISLLKAIKAKVDSQRTALDRRTLATIVI